MPPSSHNAPVDVKLQDGTTIQMATLEMHHFLQLERHVRELNQGLASLTELLLYGKTSLGNIHLAAIAIRECNPRLSDGAAKDLVIANYSAVLDAMEIADPEPDGQDVKALKKEKKKSDQEKEEPADPQEAAPSTVTAT